MSWRTTRAFADGGAPIVADDISRIVESARGTAIVLADASAAAFERVAPVVSRAMIDAAIAAWAAGDDPFAAARGVAGTAEGWLLLATLADDAEIAWIGAHAAWQMRSGTLVTRSSRHSLRATHPTAPDVATRSLAAGAPDRERWPVVAGDRVVLSRGIGPVLDDADAIVHGVPADRHWVAIVAERG